MWVGVSDAWQPPGSLELGMIAATAGTAALRRAFLRLIIQLARSSIGMRERFTVFSVPKWGQTMPGITGEPYK
jgi:hypothetical protein